MSKKTQVKEEVMTQALEKKEGVPGENVIITTITPQDVKELEDRKPVTGTFHILGKTSGMVKLGACRKYKDDPLTPRFFKHGETYTVPKWYADWLNAAENDMNTPGCCKLNHTAQYVDLQQQYPLAEPEKQKLYSFTPMAKW